MSVRSLVLVAASCSVFGGCIGAAATAATQSQASPEAIAAAVQRVQDQTADRTLRQIRTKLAAINTQLKTTDDHMRQDLDGVATYLTMPQGGALKASAMNLYRICNEQSDFTGCTYVAP